MTKNKFEPKGESVLKAEVIQNYGLNEGEHDDLINKIVADRLKDENFKSSLHDQKVKLKKRSSDLEKGKNFYKEQLKTSSNEQEKQFVTREELEEREKKAAHRAKYSYLDDELYSLIKTHAEANNISFRDAKKNKVFASYIEESEIESRKRGSILSPGTKISKKSNSVEKQFEDKFNRNLPPMFK